jgi:hypothetical protein
VTAPSGRTNCVVRVVLAMALVGVACGSDDGGGGSRAATEPNPVPTVGTTTASSPFVVEDPPTGYQPVLAGRGDIPQTWSSDSFGDDEPVTVLVPPGDHIGGMGAMTVSLTGYAGFEGGLDQAVAGYPAAQPEESEIDGRRALYTPPGASPAGPHGADLVVAVDEDLAVRVGSGNGSRDELAGVARRVRPQADHLLAPRVPEPPGGFQVIGSVDADVLVTLWASPLPSSDVVPAGERAHTAVWARLDGSGAGTVGPATIAVSTLPGTAVSLGALGPALAITPSGRTAKMRDATVRDRPAAIVDAGEERARFRALVTSTPGGDALLVVASGGKLPEAEDLVAVAASVQSTTAEAWDAFVVAARGGPGLRPDPGAIELERGEAEGIEWLFQARTDDGSLPFLGGGDVDPATGESRTAGEFVIDPCLKLADGQRACLGPGGSEQGFAEAVSVTRVRGPLDDGGQFPGFHMVMTTQPALILRITSTDGVREARFHQLPGGERRGAVIVTDLVGPRGCDTSVEPVPVTVELLDAAGRSLPCM